MKVVSAWCGVARSSRVGKHLLGRYKNFRVPEVEFIS